MATETFKKRQKETARREKHKLKIARRMERKNDKANGENDSDEKGPPMGEPIAPFAPMDE
jgi:hypothetical protein